MIRRLQNPDDSLEVRNRSISGSSYTALGLSCNIRQTPGTLVRTVMLGFEPRSAVHMRPTYPIVFSLAAF